MAYQPLLDILSQTLIILNIDMICKIYCLDNKSDFIGLVWFYGISTIVWYLKPNPIYIEYRYDL